MSSAVREAADALARRSEACQGYQADAVRVQEKLRGAGAEWYAELLATIPLCGLRLGWQPAGDPTEDLLWIRIADEWELVRLPGYVIFGYGTADAVGDRYAFPTTGSDPPVLRLGPDAMSGEPVAARLSDLLRWAPVLVWDEATD